MPHPRHSPAIASLAAPAARLARAAAVALALCWCCAGAASAMAAAPIISRGKPVFASDDAANASALVDGSYSGPTWNPPNLPCWAAIHVGAGPTRVLVSWMSPWNYNYDTCTLCPGAFTVETSADSTDGADGTWAVAATVSGNAHHLCANAVPFAGQSWVRLRITASAWSDGIKLIEIDVHDLSAGADDTWFFMGDSITAGTFDRYDWHSPSFSSRVHAAHPAFQPATINGGIGGTASWHAQSEIDGYLALNPDFHYWALAYGTNDSWGLDDPAGFKSRMQDVINHIVTAGRVPVIARIPYAIGSVHDAIPAYNDVIDQLAAENGLRPGPDLYAWFLAHPEELGPDGVHPSDTGAVSINRLWAEAMDGLYASVPPGSTTTGAGTGTGTGTGSTATASASEAGGSPQSGCGFGAAAALAALTLASLRRRRSFSAAPRAGDAAARQP